jgi:hypothetical protein
VAPPGDVTASAPIVSAASHEWKKARPALGSEKGVQLRELELKLPEAGEQGLQAGEPASA